MKKIAKIEIKLFQSDTYRAMLAKYCAPGALLIVRLQVMEQVGTLPDFTDERQLLILANEIGSDAATVAEMLATLRQWNSRDAQPVSQEQNVDSQPTDTVAAVPDNTKPSRATRQKQCRKERRQARRQLRAIVLRYKTGEHDFSRGPARSGEWQMANEWSEGAPPLMRRNHATRGRHD